MKKKFDEKFFFALNVFNRAIKKNFCDKYKVDTKRRKHKRC